MAREDQMPPKLAHGIGEVGCFEPTGAPGSTGVKMGPPVFDPGKVVTPMTEGIGEIPISNTSADTNKVPIDGLHDVGSIDGKDGGGKPGSLGSPESHRMNSTGMTYKYPGL